MNIVQNIIKEILSFGPKNTLDSIERIKSPVMRLQYRRAFEEAFKVLKIGDFRFIKIDWPSTKDYNLCT
jgi:hypothetical protein